MDENEKKCQFCGKPKSSGKRFIGEGGVIICEDCIKSSYDIIQRLNRAELEKKRGGIPVQDLKKPSEIMDFLNQYVIGQDRAKKSIAVAVYNHYKRINNNIGKGGDQDVDLEKSNILMIGPTGSGKTYLARTLARILGVPFAISDATTLTEAGYVGEDVENVLVRLLQETNYDVPKAERGIVPRDLMKFGLTPEFVGRLPVIVALNELDEEDMVRILTEPKNALVRQYQKLMELEGVELEVEPEALREIAQIAMRRNTGARGLRAIMEDIMEDIMFSIPDEKNVKKCILTKAAVLGEEKPVIIRDERDKPA